MFTTIKEQHLIKKVPNFKWYSIFRQHLGNHDHFLDDRGSFSAGEKILIDWPAEIRKPRFGIVCDYDPYPGWTKHCRFLDNNGFDYDIYALHARDWIEKAAPLGIIVGIRSSEPTGYMNWHCESSC